MQAKVQYTHKNMSIMRKQKHSWTASTTGTIPSWIQSWKQMPTMSMKQQNRIYSNMLDPITEQEIREYEEYCKQQEEQSIEDCDCRDTFDRWDEEDWKELAENADYYNDYLDD